MGELTEYADYDALGLAKLVADGEVTPRELVESAIARIDRLNPKLNAVIHRLYDTARARAGDLPEGPFRGVPFLLKDLEAPLAGAPMTNGSAFFRGWHPPRSSELVKRFLRAGLIVVGKSNTPEFGMIPTTEPDALGPTRNPWDLELSAGGSSGGTGAAVAARLVPMGSGGDGGGSIRIPASCNGVFGIKPTRGRTPSGPDAAEGWNGFSIQFALSRSVRDSAALLDAVSGPMVGDWHSLPRPEASFLSEVGRPPGKLRIAFSADPLLPGEVHPDCTAALSATVEKLRELGHELIEAKPKLDGRLFARQFLTVVGAQIAANIVEAERDVGRRARRGDFEDTTWLAATMGRSASAAEYALAMRALQRLVRPVHELLNDYDVYLCPTLATPPGRLGFLDAKGLAGVVEKLAGRVPIGPLLKLEPLVEQAAAETYAFIPYTPVFNVTGQPSMSVPLHWNAADVPVGTMFSAAYGNEALLFRLAAQLEEAHPWKDRRPPIS